MNTKTGRPMLTHVEHQGVRWAARLFIAPSRTKQLMLDKTTSIDMI
jgi:hypothetical protein